MNPNGQRADVTMCQNHRPARRMHRAGDKRIVRALPPLFPLLRTTTRVVFLDDDVRYLQMLSIAIPERFAASLYSAGVEAANDLQASLAHLARERSGAAWPGLLLTERNPSYSRFDICMIRPGSSSQVSLGATTRCPTRQALRSAPNMR